MKRNLVQNSKAPRQVPNDSISLVDDDHAGKCYQELIDAVVPIPGEQISQKGKAAPRHITPAMESALPPYPIVWIYFVKNKYPAEEAEKFYNAFQIISWKSFGIKRIENWQQLADQWMNNLKKSK
ncbi:MAG: hypothetical protein JST39_20870 [Bacteroidetes bacterium]|nr:hypothetical protein [Bacteroidota bacterium]